MSSRPFCHGDSEGGVNGDAIVQFPPSVKFMRDRLTLLPDPILVQILSLLTLRDAVLTTVLSKPWVNLWTQLTSLVFRFHAPEWTGNNDNKFTSFVAGALDCHSRYNAFHLAVDDFCISFDNYSRKLHEDLVNSWLRYVTNRNAKQIDLIFHEHPELNPVSWCYELYDVPMFLFMQNHVLTKLKLNHCRLYIRSFDNQDIIRCNSLRSLSLNQCCLRFGSQLLAGCPVLERLELVHCWIMVDNLDIYHDCLKELVIHDIVVCQTIRISTPNLRTLTLSGRIPYIISKIEVIRLNSSIVEAFFDLPSFAFYVIKKLIDVKKLKVGSLAIQALSNPGRTAQRHMPPPELSCTSLVLLTRMKRSEVSGLAWLLQRCTLLETLTVDMTTTKPLSSKQSLSNVNNAGVSIWTSQGIDGNLTCFDHLKYVDVIGLVPNHDQAKQPLTEFLQLLLEHGKVLKKLSIKTPRQNDMSTLDENMCLNSHFELARLLLSSPRFSQDTEIRFTEL